ncbi:MAG: MBL fold metallo-hydrolase [Deltaproteobacteria bacterium]|nr:MBL fold metallo-hydrolase [Deltaproteobacteria bacterium]
MTKLILPKSIIPLKLPMQGFWGSVTVYLLRSEKENVLIDCGMGDESSIESLKNQLALYNLKLADITKVIATHYHVDHMGLCSYFQNLGAKIAVSDKTAVDLKSYFKYSDRDDMRAVLYGRHDVPEDFKESVGSIFRFFRNYHTDLIPDEIFTEGDIIEAGDFKLYALSAPGHTEDHHIFYLKDENLIFTGDHILDFSTPHVCFSYESSVDDVLSQYIDSLKRLSVFAKGATALPAHGGYIENIVERVDEMILFYDKKIQSVLEVLDSTPSSCFEISQKALGKKRSPMAQWLAASLTLSCLEHLTSTDKIKCDTTGDVIKYSK